MGLLQALWLPYNPCVASTQGQVCGAWGLGPCGFQKGGQYCPSTTYHSHKGLESPEASWRTLCTASVHVGMPSVHVRTRPYALREGARCLRRPLEASGGFWKGPEARGVGWVGDGLFRNRSGSLPRGLQGLGGSGGSWGNSYLGLSLLSHSGLPTSYLPMDAPAPFAIQDYKQELAERLSLTEVDRDVGAGALEAARGDVAKAMDLIFETAGRLED